MHGYLLVIGEDPIERAMGLSLSIGTTDWVRIGGAYSGALPVLGSRGAGETNDAMPPALKARLRGVLSEPGANPPRIRPDGLLGVDQIRRGDLDLSAIESPSYILDEQGKVHDPGYTPDEEVLEITLGMAAAAGITLEEAPDEDELARFEAKTRAWDRRVREILAALPDDALLTVIDVHA